MYRPTSSTYYLTSLGVDTYEKESQVCFHKAKVYLMIKSTTKKKSLFDITYNLRFKRMQHTHKHKIKKVARLESESNLKQASHFSISTWHECDASMKYFQLHKRQYNSNNHTFFNLTGVLSHNSRKMDDFKQQVIPALYLSYLRQC
jgi:hypothetical protein